MLAMWLKQCHKPAIWEWFIAPIKMGMTGMVYDCFNMFQPHYTV